MLKYFLMEKKLIMGKNVQFEGDFVFKVYYFRIFVELDLKVVTICSRVNIYD